MKLTSPEVKTVINNRFPGIGICTHGLPGYPDILCIDFTNCGDETLPELLRHAMLVPEAIENPPFMGPDRSVYKVPVNHDTITITMETGAVADKLLFTAFIEVSANGVSVGNPLPHLIYATNV